jgi:hypothetical protein
MLETRTMLSGIDVLSYRNGPANLGWNQSETLLTPANVNEASFGRLFTTYLDGQVYAQPLVVTGVDISVGPEAGIHNVVLVATENDSVYALDASTGVILWQDSFVDPQDGITAVPSGELGQNTIVPEVGITSTPVVNRASNLVYLVARTKEPRSDGTHYVFSLHAINLSSGAEALGGPVVIADTLHVNGNYTYVSGPSVKGMGDGSAGGMVPFNAMRENQRSALTLSHGQVYIAFASLGDIGPYHGWILGYDASSLQLTAVFNTTPDGGQGGIWMSGAGIAVDPQGFLYAVTGNGTFDTALNAARFPSDGDYGDSVLKLAVDPGSTPADPGPNGWGLKVVDYFTPYKQAGLNANDLDLGSSGPTLLPVSAGSRAHPHLMLVAGKQGRIYLLDRDDLGEFHTRADHVVQEIGNAIKPVYSSPAVLGNKVYYVAWNDFAKAFVVKHAAMSSQAVDHSRRTFGYPGATPSVSSDGARNEILWIIDRNENDLQAYAATNLRRKLYSSAAAPFERDTLGLIISFSVPTVADGCVYVGTFNSLVAYGLLQSADRAPEQAIRTGSGLESSASREPSSRIWDER